MLIDRPDTQDSPIEPNEEPGRLTPASEHDPAPSTGDQTIIDHYARELAQALAQARLLEATLSRSKSIVMRWRPEPEFPIDYVTENVEQLGCSAADLVHGTVSWTDMLHPEDAARLDGLLEKHLLADDDEYVLDYRVVDRGGELRWVTDRTRALRDTSGRIVQYESVIVDITERIVRERELEQLASIASRLGAVLTLEQMKPAILDAVCGAFNTNTAGLMLYSPAHGGLMVEGACGEWVGEIGAGPWPEASLVGKVFARHRSVVVNDVHLQRHIPRPDLVANLQAVACVPLLVADTALGVLAVGRRLRLGATDSRLFATIADIAASAIHRAAVMETLEQRVAQRTQELVEANRRLAELSRHKDEFLAVMSHELRTPLASVLSLSEALTRKVYGPLTPRQQHPVGIIYESGRHLLGLINDMLDLSHIEAGLQSTEFQPVALEEVVHLCCELIGESAQRKQLTFTYAISPGSIAMMADERRLRQLLMNLLANAVKFTPEGGRFGVRVDGDTTRDFVCLSVWDTGIGIAAEDQVRIFEPFVQLDTGLARQYDGAGVGLALVQRIATMHGGWVTMRSQPGQGSEFVVTLPWRRPEQRLPNE